MKNNAEKDSVSEWEASKGTVEGKLNFLIAPTVLAIKWQIKQKQEEAKRSCKGSEGHTRLGLGLG